MSDAPPPPFRAPFRWPIMRLAPRTDTPLRPRAAVASCASGGWLRISVAISDYDQKQVVVHLADGSKQLGTFDLRCAHSLAPFQLRLSAEDYAEVARQGVILNLSVGASPLWIFAHGLPSDAASFEPTLAPDIAGDPLARFFGLLASRATAQPFGWMEGCVLDALHDLHAATGDARWRAAFDAHLALFVTEDNRLVYEPPGGRPADGTIYSIEGTLPFAPLAKFAPDHPLLALALDYLCGRHNPDGTFIEPEAYTAEGSYTIAYPLAALAQARRDSNLASLAANVLRVRHARLRRPDGLWLRRHTDDSLTFRSWARGVAWYLLGLARSIEHLEDLTDTADLKIELRDAAEWALRWQRSDGLWGNYLDDNEALQDTSGSAGIAAAFARGVGLGLLPDVFRDAAERCWSGLLRHLTPDGFLDGASQGNRGGEPLQRAPYRVLSPMGMGLMGQLAAALGHVR